MPQQEATTNKPFSPFFISLLVGVTTVVVVNLLLIAPQQEEAAWAQPADAPQVYCGPWEIESRVPGTTGISDWQFWTYRWCYSPEVAGGWYKDYAGYSLTAPDVTLTYTPSADSVTVGEPVTFTIAETNNEPYALNGVSVTVHPKSFEITSPTEFVSVTLSQGQCEFPLSQGGRRLFPSLICYLGTMPPGDTAVIDLVVAPQEPGIISTYVADGVDPISDGKCCGQGFPLTRYGVQASNVSVYSAGVPKDKDVAITLI